MNDQNDEGRNGEGKAPRGAEGAQLKKDITEAKGGDQGRTFDPGASMLGTDNEAGTTPDKDEMAQARNAPPPPSAA